MSRRQSHVRGESTVGQVRDELHHRVLRNLDRALRSLSLVEDDPEASVHDARRRIKRVRAVVRLIRRTSKKQFAMEDQILAEASRRLGPIRDRHVAQHLASNLGRWPGEMVPPPMAPSVRAMVTLTSIDLLGVRARATMWDFEQIDNQTVMAELDRSYRLARRRWNRASEHLESDELHGCRKAVKRTSNQLNLVSPNVRRDERLADLKLLGEVLGKHHDLALIPDHDRHDESDLLATVVEVAKRVFALTPKQHATWVAGLLGPRQV